MRTFQKTHHILLPLEAGRICPKSEARWRRSTIHWGLQHSPPASVFSSDFRLTWFCGILIWQELVLLVFSMGWLRIQKTPELEAEDEMDEVECLLEEVSPQGPLASSKGRSYRKAGRIIRMPPECSVPPQLTVWPTRNKYKLLQAGGEYEHVIPVVYQLKRQDGCESTGVSLQRKHTMPKPEGLQSRRASHKSLECNCEKSKTKFPCKVTEIRGRCYKV